MRFGVEDCDGEDLGGETCASRGYTFGILKCTPACTLDVRGCGDAVVIPAGEFVMGSPLEEEGRYGNETQHRVTLTHDYLLQTTEVTQAQFESVMGYNPSEQKACGPSCPVDSVSWHEVAAFTNTLSLADELSPCYTCDGSGMDVTCHFSPAFPSPYECPGWRLPFEAEWEYAARAGDPRATYNGEATDTYCAHPNEVLDPIAWFCGNSDYVPHAVGALRPNAWGLHDMLGNVWEWCSDWAWWIDGAYPNHPSDPLSDPASTEGDVQVSRGGAWNNFERILRAGSRSQPGGNPPTRNYLLGARAARTLFE
jgi:formylglycine-generating enzyme required for sulfatase activity